MGIKTKLTARLAIWQRADLFEASNSANKISLPLRCIFLAFLRRSSYKLFQGSLLPWQNSRHFATPPQVSPRKQVWKTIAENATPFRSGSGKFPLTNHKHYPDRVISMEFLRTFLGGEVAKCRLFSSLRLFFVVIARSPGSDSTEVLFPLISFKFWYLTVVF